MGQKRREKAKKIKGMIRKEKQKIKSDEMKEIKKEKTRNKGKETRGMET